MRILRTFFHLLKCRDQFLLCAIESTGIVLQLADCCLSLLVAFDWSDELTARRAAHGSSALIQLDHRILESGPDEDVLVFAVYHEDQAAFGAFPEGDRANWVTFRLLLETEFDIALFSLFFQLLFNLVTVSEDYLHETLLDYILDIGDGLLIFRLAHEVQDSEEHDG